MRDGNSSQKHQQGDRQAETPTEQGGAGGTLPRPLLSLTVSRGPESSSTTTPDVTVFSDTAQHPRDVGLSSGGKAQAPGTKDEESPVMRQPR